MSDRDKPPTKIAQGKFEIDKKLGAGCFGEVWRGTNTETKEQVAVKFEHFQGHTTLQLEHEVEILKVLGQPILPQGFVECFHLGLEGKYQCMVMELLGRSLEERLKTQGGKFNVPTAVLIAEQVLHRIEYLHSKGIIHRDIKPENFMFGVKNKVHHIYLIDFGLSKRYYDGKHVPIRSKLSLTGTARYASINAHKGVEQSRRDDMEAIGHMLVYFLRSQLPWSGLDAKTQEEKYRKIRERKEQVPLDELCAGFPSAFQGYLDKARLLEFKERPDYDCYRKLFREVREAQQPQPPEDHHFPWLEGKELGPLVELKYEPLRQPDDPSAQRGSSGGGGGKKGFCLCGGSSKVKDD
uniref:Casein kinase I n=1 Tax=Alexandrium catenella TaxID=2925 RepID=A0A7S1RS09_ALECA|mmetsp:Transcript_69819/g.185556  ORF Transcript_69819/g.185556 Transcript_69819/m.185556 type:complete len:352 (+) Transcript_69819:94-1149(+)|eukprot:CAMPEP_0171184674 /NCGR_PEP_ID=MMETSP0790-20130122/15906_1 /TAXON_ID=2925 /ORGANISM="Alexandrium catenella, Strain OF101" /LENGTH=351 /DNA_ID=CAMNT_0011649669 /DNA_START=94 /DNA_END=1149 /DNA_ORIENTATION=+